MYGKRSVPVTTESGRTRGVPRDVWKRDSLHGVPWRGVVETWQPPWSPMERCGGNVATSMESHGEVWWKRGSFHRVPWTAQFWMRDWWCDTTAGNGCSGMHRLTVSRQLATDAVVHRPTLSRQLATDAVVRIISTGHDSWCWNALDSRSSEVSVLISGRLRRMVSEVFGKHFGVVYSWSTMSSSFVSCLAW